MATISITTPSDGQTIDASDVATPLNTIVSEINGSLDSDNIASGGVVPNSLTSGTGTSWAWQSWTPTLTGITEGNGTKTASYVQIGKTVFWRFKFVLGSTSSITGEVALTAPVTAASYYGSEINKVGDTILSDTGTAAFLGTAWFSGSTSSIVLRTLNDAGTNQIRPVSMSSTVPFTWSGANADYITAEGTYEAA